MDTLICEGALTTTVAMPHFVEPAMLVAVILTSPGSAPACQVPSCWIVPPLADHRTRWSLVPATLAVNRTMHPPQASTDAGSTDTATSCRFEFATTTTAVA